MRSLFPETPEGLGLGAQVVSYHPPALELDPWEWGSCNWACSTGSFLKVLFSLFRVFSVLPYAQHTALNMCLIGERLVPLL